MILHLDMDAFFASVEQMDNPRLRGKAVIVGGQMRGVVATASYEARVYGVHSAMPVATARKLCPHGIYLKGNFRRYAELSSLIMTSLHEFSPVVQAASIDEAYLDITKSIGLYANAEELARDIKKRVAETTGGLTCSVGIAPVKFLAKICSDINKPDGIYVLEPAAVSAFLRELNVCRIPGVGKSMAASLKAYGITTVGQLRELSREFLRARYGKWGLVLHDRAHGKDERMVHANLPAKSESVERTFDKDTLDRDLLQQALMAHAEKVGQRLQKHGMAGRTITLKVKFANFRTITRAQTLEIQTNDPGLIYAIGRGLLAREKLPQPVRLIGLGVSGFEFRQSQFYLPGMGLTGSCGKLYDFPITR